MVNWELKLLCSYVHRLKGYADPTKVFLILKLLSAIKSRSRPDIRFPITLPVLRLLVDALKQTSSSFYLRTLFTAMFLTAVKGCQKHRVREFS